MRSTPAICTAARLEANPAVCADTVAGNSKGTQATAAAATVTVLKEPLRCDAEKVSSSMVKSGGCVTVPFCAPGLWSGKVTEPVPETLRPNVIRFLVNSGQALALFAEKVPLHHGHPAQAPERRRLQNQLCAGPRQGDHGVACLIPTPLVTPSLSRTMPDAIIYIAPSPRGCCRRQRFDAWFYRFCGWMVHRDGMR
jgi:hypothetical protein